MSEKGQKIFCPFLFALLFHKPTFELLNYKPLMKKLLVTALTIFSLATYAQSPVSIGLITSFDKIKKRGYFNESNFRLDYQMGIRVKYDFGGNFSLITGASLITERSYSEVFYPISIHNYSAQLPLIASLYFGNKLRYGFSLGGAYTNFFRTIYSIDNAISSSNYKEEGVLGLASIGVEYSIKKLTFRLEPNSSVMFWNTYQPNIDKSHIGLGWSAYYDLGK